MHLKSIDCQEVLHLTLYSGQEHRRFLDILCISTKVYLDISNMLSVIVLDDFTMSRTPIFDTGFLDIFKNVKKSDTNIEKHQETLFFFVVYIDYKRRKKRMI